MRRLPVLLVLAIVMVGTLSCNSNGELALNNVTNSEYESVQKLRGGQ
jgi:hypothetical protein